MRIRKRLLALALMSCAVAGIVAQNNDHNFKVAKNIDLFTAIYKNLDMLYVDSLDADKVIGEGIDAMLASTGIRNTIAPRTPTTLSSNLLANMPA